LASERGRDLTPETLKLRWAAIRYLHRAAGCPVPTDDVAVSETLAGILRILAPKSPTTCDRALILAGFAGALSHLELAAIRVEQLEKTEHWLRLTLAPDQRFAGVSGVVPSPCGHTELCPRVH
jgi:hypothetical protein